MGPKTIPLNEKSFTPPSIEKKIKKGCIFILSFRKNGRKRLSNELIPSPATIRKTIAFNAPDEKKRPTPTGNHTKPQPIKGKNELKKVNMASNKAPSIPKIK